MVGLISMMTGSALQEDIAATTRALLSKGQDILGMEALESQRRILTMKTKRVLLSGTAAPCAAPFSWIDQRLVRDGHIARCGPQALALYLLLVTVADAQGLSYYSDKTAARLLSLNEAQLREARCSLLAAGLIAYESPLYQVLSLEPTSSQ